MMDGSVIQGIPDEITIPADFEEWLFYDRMLWVRKAREHELDRLARAVAAQTDVMPVAESGFLRELPPCDGESYRLVAIHDRLDGYFRAINEAMELTCDDTFEVGAMQDCTAHLLAHGTVDEDLYPNFRALFT
jgi:hypothetical protein